MIQVYTGNGKGKTTAALGMAVRAVGAGKKVYICQFLKGRYYCELATLKKLKNIKLEQFGTSCFVKKSPSAKDKELAGKGLAAAKKVLSSQLDIVVILDEINVACQLGLIDVKDVLRILKEMPKENEVILTGRNAPAEILKIADLVSEIKEVKHYFNKGVRARKGIEY